MVIDFWNDSAFRCHGSVHPHRCGGTERARTRPGVFHCCFYWSESEPWCLASPFVLHMSGLASHPYSIWTIDLVMFVIRPCSTYLLLVRSNAVRPSFLSPSGLPLFVSISSPFQLLTSLFAVSIFPLSSSANSRCSRELILISLLCLSSLLNVSSINPQGKLIKTHLRLRHSPTRSQLG